VVFEADLTLVKNSVNSNQFQKALSDIEALRTKVENRYNNLNPQQKLQWEDTRSQILHALEHITETSNGHNIPEQKSRCIRILNEITVI
jgi:hypothetical protein